MSTPASSAFISYSRDDSEFALRLAKELKAAGASVWLDQLELKAGLPWDNAIEDALLAAPEMLVILSPTSVKSENVRDEISYALRLGKVVVPILYVECVVPLRLQRKQHIDFRTDHTRGLTALLDHLHVNDYNQSLLSQVADEGPKCKTGQQAQETRVGDTRSAAHTAPAQLAHVGSRDRSDISVNRKILAVFVPFNKLNQGPFKQINEKKERSNPSTRELAIFGIAFFGLAYPLGAYVHAIWAIVAVWAGLASLFGAVASFFLSKDSAKIVDEYSYTVYYKDAQLLRAHRILMCLKTDETFNSRSSAVIVDRQTDSVLTLQCAANEVEAYIAAARRIRETELRVDPSKPINILEFGNLWTISQIVDLASKKTDRHQDNFDTNWI